MNRAQLGASLNLKEAPIPAGQLNRPGTGITPTSITIHNTSNAAAGADADAHARFVTRTGFYELPSGRKSWVSWHYTVDDVEVVKHLPISEKALHAGPANASSIAIETCMHSGIDQAAADDRLARLVAILRFDLGLGRDAIRSHRDWTGKDCPVLLLPQWNGLLDRIDAYVQGMVAGAAAPFAMAASAQEGEIDHGLMAMALNAQTAPDHGTMGQAPMDTGMMGHPLLAPAVHAPAVTGNPPPDTVEADEPDESFTCWQQSLLAYDSPATLQSAIQATPFSAFSSYKSDFEASYADLNIQHFKPHEFLTMGGRNGDPQSNCYNKNHLPDRALWPNMRPLARALEEIRRRLQMRVRLTSVYRSPEYNACLPGSAARSYHMEFKAADFQGETGTPADWYAAALAVRNDGVFVGGISQYSNFVHVDVRGTNVGW